MEHQRQSEFASELELRFEDLDLPSHGDFGRSQTIETALAERDGPGLEELATQSDQRLVQVRDAFCPPGMDSVTAVDSRYCSQSADTRPLLGRAPRDEPVGDARATRRSQVFVTRSVEFRKVEMTMTVEQTAA